MTNTLKISQIAVPFIAVFALIALLFSAMPASAQVTQSENCTLVKDIKVKTVAGSATFKTGVIVQDGTTSIDSLNTDTAGNFVSPATVSTATGTVSVREWGILCLLNTINTLVDWVSVIVLILSTGLIVYAGFLWMTSGQSPDNQKKAGAFILAALIGFAIVILARIFPAVVSGILL